MMQTKRGATLVLTGLTLLMVLERRRRLRRSVEPKARRTGRNLAIAAVSAAVLQVADRPVVEPLTALVEQRRWGLLKQAHLPGASVIPDEKISLNVSRRLVSPVCIAGVLPSLPNFSAL